MSVSSLLNKTCTIKRKTLAQSSTTGAMTNTLASVATGVRCTCQVDGGDERDFGGRETGVTRFRFYFLPGQIIKVQDELSAVTGYTSVVFDVKSVGMDDAGRGAYIKVLAEDRKGQVQPA